MESNFPIHIAAEQYLIMAGTLENERLGTGTIKYFNVCVDI